MDSEKFETIKKNFHEYFMKNSPLGILLFGSKAAGEDTLRSDIDVCIVLGSKNNLMDEIRLAWQHVGGRYDLWLFEELPIYMQAQVIDNHKIIYCDDYPLLTEYFYDFRKLVETYRYRVKQAQ